MAIDDEQETVSARIDALMDECSEAERRVARALRADYPVAGLGSSHALAATAGVSAPTVVRFAARLGFDGFSDMQRHLHAEISDSGSSPVARTMANTALPRSEDPMSAAMRLRSDAIASTLTRLPPSEFARAVALIADCPRQVLVTGGFFSQSIARIMTLQLSQVRSNVVFVEEPLRRDVGMILDAKKSSVLVLYDLRRYEPAARTIAQYAARSGVDTILLTDRWMSPTATVADVVLPVDVTAVPFDTFVALLAVSEVIVESVMARLGPKALHRMKKWETHAVGHAAVGHTTNPPAVP